MIKKIRNILVIAPHADDEVLGCGGLINKYKKSEFHSFNLYECKLRGT